MPTSVALERADIGAAVTDMWRAVLLFVPKAVAFVAILAVGWFIAAAAGKLTRRGLERLGFDRAVQRGGIGQALARGRVDAGDLLARLVRYALLLLTFQLAFGVWGPNPVTDLIRGVVTWLPRAFVAIVIMVVAAAIARAVRDVISAALGGLSYGPTLGRLASWFIVGLGAIAALNQVGIATTVTTPVLLAVLATIAGVLIVGVGGGLVRPMSRRWETWLTRAESESQVIRERAQAYAAGREDMNRAMADGAGEPTTVMPRADEPVAAGVPTAPEAGESSYAPGPGTVAGSAGSGLMLPGEEWGGPSEGADVTQTMPITGGAGPGASRQEADSTQPLTGGRATYRSGNAETGDIGQTQRIEAVRDPEDR